MGKKNNGNKRLSTCEKLRKDFHDSKTRHNLLTLVVNPEFIKDNPKWVVDGDYDDGLVADIIDQQICQNLSQEDLDNIGQLCLNTLSNLKDLHNDEQNYMQFMNKFTKLSEENEGFIGLAQDVFNVLKAQYLDTLNDGDATHLAIAVVLNAALENILQLSQFASDDEYDLLQDQDNEPEEDSQETTDKDSKVPDKEPESKIQGIDFAKCRKLGEDAAAKFHKASRSESVAASSSLKDNKAEEIEKLEVLTGTVETKERQADQIVLSLSNLLIKELFNDCRCSVDNGTKLKMADEQIMEIMEQIAPKVISTNYSIDDLLAIDDASEVPAKLKREFISRFVAVAIADSMTSTTAASSSLKEEGSEDSSVFTEDLMEEVLEQLPGLKEILTPKDLLNIALLEQDSMVDGKIDQANLMNGMVELFKNSDDERQKFIKFMAWSVANANSISQVVSKSIKNSKDVGTTTEKTVTETVTEDELMNKDRADLVQFQKDHPDRKINIELGVEVRAHVRKALAKFA